MSIMTAIESVVKLSNYKPCDETNETMTSLVDAVVQNPLKSIYSVVDCDTLMQVQQVCSLTESELEMAWANIIIDSNNSVEAIKKFPYLGNYVELSRREIDLVRKSGLNLGEISRVLVIGSGPLPLSAIEIWRQTGALVDCVDISSEAINISVKVCDSLGMKSNCYISSGEAVSLDSCYDLVLIAALAGDSLIKKQAIIDNVLPNINSNGRVIVRSAKGSRELLYPAILADDILRLEKISEYHPQDDIINSVFVYKKEGEKSEN